MSLEQGALLYNLSSGHLARFGPGDGEELARLLGSSTVPYVDQSSFTDGDLWEFLLAGGFVVTAGTDEVELIKHRFWNARRHAPLVVTITVTQDCNLRCFYCYEDRTTDRLENDDIDAILIRLEQSIAQSSRSSVHVDWYGGEPLLNALFIEEGSRRIQERIGALGLGYSASIISNGTGWPDDPVAFVRRHAIREVQISFDGSREQHNRYRAYRAGGGGSFDEAVRVVDALAPECKVNLRLNLDARSARTVDAFLAFAIGRGWFEPPNRCVLQPARLAAFSKRSSFMESTQFSVTEFETVKAHIRRVAGDAARIEEAETVDGFPRPRMSVCAALGSASFVVGADLREYRCGLQVGEAGRAVGSISGSGRRLPLFDERRETSADVEFWSRFDPTERPRCSKCSFLPVCWGGCPKAHLEGNQHALDEQGKYWRENLARLISVGAGVTPRSEQIYDERFQLRVMPSA